MKSKIRQVWLKEEDTGEGVDSTPTVANARYASEPTFNPEAQTIVENYVRTNLDQTQNRIGQVRFIGNYGIDFKGGGDTVDATDVPEFDLEFRTAGMQREALYQVTGATIGVTDIKHGATFVQATSGARGVIIGEYPVGSSPGRLHYRATRATSGALSGYIAPLNAVNLVTVTNPAGGPNPTFTPGSTPNPHGNLYRFVTDAWLKATRAAWSGQPEIGEIVIGDVSGAVGRLLETTAHGSAGSVWVDVLIGTFDASDTIEGQSSGETAALSSAFSAANEANCSASAAWLLDGMKVTSTGHRSTVVLPFRTGQPMKAQIESRGFFNDVTTLVPPAMSLSAAQLAQSPRFAGGQFLLDGLPMSYLDQFELTFGNELGIRPDVAALQGGVSYRIGNRSASIRINPEFVPPAAYDFWGKWTSGSLFAVRMRTGCNELQLESTTAVGSILWIDIPQAQYGQVPIGDREGTATADANGILTGTTAGDSLGAGRSDSLYIYAL